MLVTPAAMIGVLLTMREAESLGSNPDQYVAARANSDPIVEPVDIVIARSAGPQMVAPALTGIIEAVLVSPGDTVSTGVPVLVSNGIERVAAFTSRPFGRPLVLDARGEDVQSLNALLSELGYAAGGGSKYTASTERGVRALAAQIGADPAAGFDPSWVLYMPVPQLAVAQLNLTVGAPPPAAGEVILTGAGDITETALVRPGSVAEQDNSAEVDSTVAPQPVPEASRVTSGPNTVLTIDTVQLSLADDLSSVSAASFADLAAVSGESTVVSASLVTAPAAGEFRLSPASIFGASDGQLCVVRQRGESRAAVPVQLVSSTYDYSVVTGDLVDGDLVAVDPAVEDRDC